MATRSALKKHSSGSKKNKTKKHVFINPTFNEIVEDNPHPITPRNKSDRWTTSVDEKLAREEVRNKKTRFIRARKEVPGLAAMSAIRKFNIKTHSSPDKQKDDIIEVKRNLPVLSPRKSESTWRKNTDERKKEKGIIPRLVSSVFGFFRGKKGGKKTRKNRK